LIVKYNGEIVEGDMFNEAPDLFKAESKAEIEARKFCRENNMVFVGFKSISEA